MSSITHKKDQTSRMLLKHGRDMLQNMGRAKVNGQLVIAANFGDVAFSNSNSIHTDLVSSALENRLGSCLVSLKLFFELEELLLILLK